jgi:hypothetical protein
MPPFMPYANEMYFTSMELSATTACFLLPHEISVLSIKTVEPLTNFLSSMFPAQSASV